MKILLALKRTTQPFRLALLGILVVFTNVCHGVSFSGFVVSDLSQNTIGGVETGFTARALGGVSIEASISDNWRFYVEGQLQRGGDGSQDVGDIQAYSNIDEADFSKLYEIWLEGVFMDGAFRTKLGQIDANSEFAFADNAAEFINSSMGFSPSIAFFPTYPEPTLAATAFYQFNQVTTSAVGIFSDNGNQFDDQFFIVEGQYQASNALIKLGAWQWRATLEKFSDQQQESQTSGVYIVAEGPIQSQFLSSSSAGWYAQASYGEAQFSEIDLHFGAGLIWHDVLSREGDKVGVGVSHISTSKYLHDELASHETAVELFYRYQLSESFSLKPDLQVILSPAAVRNTKDALVATLRIEFAF